MNAEAGTELATRKPNEALFNVVVDNSTRRRLLPQVNYGFDHSTYQREARGVWQRLPRQGTLPPAGALKSMVVPLFRIHSILFEFPHGSTDAAIPYIGLEVARLSRLDATPRSVADAPHDSVLARLPSLFPQVLANMSPVEFSSLAAVGPKGGATFNGILLPFQETDGHVSHIYVVLDQNEIEAADHDNVFDLTEDLLAERFDTNYALRADLDVLDLQLDQVLADLAEKELETSLAEEPVPSPLAEALDEARHLAHEVSSYDTRSRTALYRALAKALAVAIQSEIAPGEYAEHLRVADIRVSERSPMTPIAKLVFGKGFDRTRLTEYASVLAFGREQGIDTGDFAAFIAAYEGGIKGIVAAQRLRRNGNRAKEPRQVVRAAAARRFRKLPATPVESIARDGGEFGVMLFRRMGDGSVAFLGEISDDAAAVERIGNQIVKRRADGQATGQVEQG